MSSHWFLFSTRTQHEHVSHTCNYLTHTDAFLTCMGLWVCSHEAVLYMELHVAMLTLTQEQCSQQELGHVMNISLDGFWSSVTNFIPHVSLKTTRCHSKSQWITMSAAWITASKSKQQFWEIRVWNNVEDQTPDALDISGPCSISEVRDDQIFDREPTYCACCVENFKHTLLPIYLHLLQENEEKAKGQMM